MSEVEVEVFFSNGSRSSSAFFFPRSFFYMDIYLNFIFLAISILFPSTGGLDKSVVEWFKMAKVYRHFRRV